MDYAKQDGLLRGSQAEANVSALVDAMAQLLDDMGERGLSVCLAAKAQARVAFDPFIVEADYTPDMALIEARRIMSEQ